MCVCECVCLLPFNCFPSNQRGHCQVADLLKAVISHLQSLPRLIHWCVILHLFFPSSFSVNSLPSLMGATSFPLRLCSFLAAWCLSTRSFFFFTCPFLSLTWLSNFLFFSVPQQRFSNQISTGREIDLMWFKLIKTLSSNATFLANIFILFLVYYIQRLSSGYILTLMCFLLLWFQAKKTKEFWAKWPMIPCSNVIFESLILFLEFCLYVAVKWNQIWSCTFVFFSELLRNVPPHAVML